MLCKGTAFEVGTAIASGRRYQATGSPGEPARAGASQHKRLPQSRAHQRPAPHSGARALVQAASSGVFTPTPPCHKTCPELDPRRRPQQAPSGLHHVSDDSMCEQCRMSRNMACTAAFQCAARPRRGTPSGAGGRRRRGQLAKHVAEVDPAEARGVAQRRRRARALVQHGPAAGKGASGRAAAMSGPGAPVPGPRRPSRPPPMCFPHLMGASFASAAACASRLSSECSTPSTSKRRW